MHLSTTARNCLYLNWALPLEAAPTLPEPLRYEVHSSAGEDFVFTSALLFQLEGLRLRSLPFLRFSYPQMNLRLYVLDGDGMPSVLFLRTFVPFWVTPVSYLLGRQPVTSARFDYPALQEAELPTHWHWKVKRGTRLDLQATLSEPCFGPGPSLGSWETTVAYFRRRPRGMPSGRNDCARCRPPTRGWKSARWRWTCSKSSSLRRVWARRRPAYGTHLTRPGCARKSPSYSNSDAPCPSPPRAPDSRDGGFLSARRPDAVLAFKDVGNERFSTCGNP